LKLLACDVEQEGRCLALKLLLAGRLYTGRLTMVQPAERAAEEMAAAAAAAAAAEAAAAAAAAAAASAAADPPAGGVVAALKELCRQRQQQQQLEKEMLQPGQQQEQQQDAQEQQQQVLSEHDVAALLELASHRQGMCALCKLEFAEQYKQLLQCPAQHQQVQQRQQTQYTDMPPPPPQQLLGKAAATGACVSARSAADAPAQQHMPANHTGGKVQSQHVLPPPSTQQQQTPQQQNRHEQQIGQQQQQQHEAEQDRSADAAQLQQVLTGLGPPVLVSMWGKCCVAVHAECGAWSSATEQAETAQGQPDTQQQVRDSSVYTVKPFNLCSVCFVIQIPASLAAV
jgi:hypothetical protein